MLKRDSAKEIENGLRLVREAVNKAAYDKDKNIALTVIDREMRGLVGLDLMTIDTLSFDNIIELINREREYNADRYLALGEIIRLRGNLENDVNNKITYYIKAMRAYFFVYKDDEALMDKYIEGVREVVNYISEYELSLDENIILLKGYEMLGEYDKAEDILFSILKKSDGAREIIKEGNDFYNRLKEKEDVLLEKGNLPREEVEDGLKQIEAMR